jgi:hypothetical protein
MAILSYDEVKDKASTLRAMTSLDREEFEALAVVFGQVSDERNVCLTNRSPGPIHETRAWPNS